MSAIDKLTPSDINALRIFARVCNNGIRWKGSLRDAWERGYYKGVDADTKATLQGLRNSLGTSWLSQFKFSAQVIKFPQVNP